MSVDIKYLKSQGADGPRFWGRVLFQAPGGCWLWNAGKDSKKYGRFTNKGKTLYAHIISFTAFNGPTPEGKEIDHVCRNTSCLNPAHLEAVTHRENIMRSESPWAKNAAKTQCKRGHEFTIENTRTYKGTRICRTCMKFHMRSWRKGEKLQ